MRRVTLAYFTTLFWVLSTSSWVPNTNSPSQACTEENCGEADIDVGGLWQVGPDEIPQSKRGEQQLLRVLRDPHSRHQYFRVLKRNGGDQFLRVLRAEERKPSIMEGTGLQRQMRGEQQFFRVLKRGTGSGTWTGTPLQRVSRGEAQFLRVLRGSADEEQ